MVRPRGGSAELRATARQAKVSAGGFARTPEPPYYAVIFTSTRTAVDEGYGAMADRMVELASQQPGFLGVESTRGADGLGIRVERAYGGPRNA
jgi:hypothetical protein